MGENREMLQRYSLAVVSHLLLVLAWYLFVELGHVPKFVLPSPAATVQSLLVPNYRWFDNTLVTGAEIFGGYVLAVGIGIGTALLFSWSRALEMFIVEGIHTTIPLHRKILHDPEFRAGHTDTGFIERFLAKTHQEKIT